MTDERATAPAGPHSAVRPALLEKLKLLPLRERELSTLRQTHQHQQRWIAEQMAGGFAHEMRNALSGAKIMIEKGIGAGNASGRSVIDESAEALKQLFLTAREQLDEHALAAFKRGVQDVARNERLLDDTLTSVHRSIQRALAITGLIMEYSRVWFSRRGDDRIDVAEIARTIVTESQASFAANGVSAVVQAPAPCLVLANEAHLYSILKNLIINAFDALCEVEDGRARRLVVEVARSGENALCRVRDNANGIPMEFQERIFEPFFSTKPQTGTRLGLGMVLKLITLHEGTIQLATEAGRGTTFTVEIPTLIERDPADSARRGSPLQFTEAGGASVAR